MGSMLGELYKLFGLESQGVMPIFSMRLTSNARMVFCGVRRIMVANFVRRSNALALDWPIILK